MATEQANNESEERTDYDGGTVPFAGLTRYSDPDDSIIPDTWGHGSSMRWWASEKTGEENPTELPGDGLNTVINRLPRATTVESGWKHPVTGEWVETSKHNALVNPEKVESMVGQDEVYDTVESARLDGHGNDAVQEMIVGDDALYYIPSDDYTVINPSTALRPLATVLQEEGLEDAVFGEFRVSRGGGRVSADILFDGKHVEHPDMDDDRKPIAVGLEIGYDFFGGTAFRARGLGMDFECVNALRGITDWEIIKHSGDLDRVNWHDFWSDLLEAVDLKADQLSQLIAAADSMEFDVSELPDDFADDHDSILHAFYDYAGLPDYLAQVAAENARAEADDPFAPTWWELHRGATYAITHHARGDVMGGGAIDAYNRTANDMLLNPAGFEETVTDRYEKARDQRDAELAEEGGGKADIATVFQSVREKKDDFEERAKTIETMVEEAPEA